MKRKSANCKNPIRMQRQPMEGATRIYSILDGVGIYGLGSHFRMSWDSTDHFAFICSKCFHVAEVTAVTIRHDDHCLTFSLACPECKATGARKMYLDRSIAHRRAFCQTTYMDDGRVVEYLEGHRAAGTHFHNRSLRKCHACCSDHGGRQ